MKKCILGFGFSLGLVIISSLIISLAIETSSSIEKLSSVLSIKNVEADMDPVKDAEDQYCLEPPGVIGCSYWRNHQCETGIMCINP